MIGVIFYWVFCSIVVGYVCGTHYCERREPPEEEEEVIRGASSGEKNERSEVGGKHVE